MIAVEPVVLAYLAAAFPAPARVVTEAPADLSGSVIRVVRVSGGSDRTIDRPILQIDAWGTGREAAATLAEQVRDAMRALQGQTVNGLAVSSVGVTMAPRWLPWDNTQVRRYTATYELFCIAA